MFQVLVTLLVILSVMGDPEPPPKAKKTTLDDDFEKMYGHLAAEIENRKPNEVFLPKMPTKILLQTVSKEKFSTIPHKKIPKLPEKTPLKTAEEKSTVVPGEKLSTVSVPQMVPIKVPLPELPIPSQILTDSDKGAPTLSAHSYGNIEGFASGFNRSNALSVHITHSENIHFNYKVGNGQIIQI